MLAGFFYFKVTTIQPAHAGSVRIAIAGSPRFLNPVLSQTSDADRDVTAVIFSSLLKYDGQGNLINDLAENYAIGEEGRVYEITIRQNAKWHDGQKLTADDVLFTLQTIQAPDFRSPLRALWQGVLIEKLDDYRLRFTLKSAYSPFLHNLTFGILPKHLWENINAARFSLAELNLKPVGSGPYRFVSLEKDSNGTVKTLELESFNDYFAGRPNLTEVVFKFYSSESEAYNGYKKDEVDIFSFVSPRNWLDSKSKNTADLSVFQIKLPRYFAAFFNQSQNKFLADKNIRLALAYATDKQEIIDTVFGGYAKMIDSPLLPQTIGYSENTKKYDFSLAQAKEILTAAGFSDTDSDGFLENTKTGEKLEITLTAINWPELTRAAELLQKQWQAAGFKINLDLKDNALIQAESIKPRQYQILLFGEVIGIEPDLFHFWHSSQTKEAGLNLSMYENPNADKALSEAISDLDNASRAQKYQSAVSLIVEDLPAIFLFSPDYLLLAKNNLQGINLNFLDVPSSRFSQINQWYTETQRAFK